MAVRRSLRAFRSTPVKNLLAEGGFLSIEDRIQYLRSRIVYKLFCTSEHILHQEIQLLKQRKTCMSHKSALCEIKELASDLNMDAHPMKIPATKFPPWALKRNVFVNELTLLRKEITNNSTYQSHFYSVANPLQENGWNFIYTDGSKQDDGVSFAVTNSNGDTLTCGLLPNYATIFDAELQGILSALSVTKVINNKTVICTDSLSVFKAAKRFRITVDPLYRSQQLLISLSPKVKLMWVPSHAGITGNEYADKAAKRALKLCLHYHMPFGQKSIKNIFSKAMGSRQERSWSNYKHQYKEVNLHGNGIILPTNTSTWMNKCFIRLRLGHCLLTHEYLLKNSQPPSCTFCNKSDLSVRHILLSCTAISHLRTQYFANKNPIEILSNASETNVKLIFNFLKHLNMAHLI